MVYLIIAIVCYGIIFGVALELQHWAFDCRPSYSGTTIISSMFWPISLIIALLIVTIIGIPYLGVLLTRSIINKVTE